MQSISPFLKPGMVVTDCLYRKENRMTKQLCHVDLLSGSAGKLVYQLLKMRLTCLTFSYKSIYQSSVILHSFNNI